MGNEPLYPQYLSIYVLKTRKQFNKWSIIKFIF